MQVDNTPQPRDPNIATNSRLYVCVCIARMCLISLIKRRMPASRRTIQPAPGTRSISFKFAYTHSMRWCRCTWNHRKLIIIMSASLRSLCDEIASAGGLPPPSSSDQRVNYIALPTADSDPPPAADSPQTRKHSTRLYQTNGKQKTSQAMSRSSAFYHRQRHNSNTVI